jgi:UDP-N-acetylglucosamine 1-carboxyvinyltransferase
MQNDTLTLRGGKPLNGTIQVRGAKNALAKEMVAALLSESTSTFSNISLVRDTTLVAEMIQTMGGEAIIDATNYTLTINAADLNPLSPEELDQFAGKSRIPILLCGPMLHRFGKVVIPQLGGCNIGARPIDFHLEALEQMGAVITQDDRYITLEAKRLRGTKLTLEYPSVMATEQILIAASLADGITEISNAAVEPEIYDLICVLQQMGANISVETDRTIRILGVEKLHGFNHHVIPDRIEVASWACAALATNGRIMIKGAQQVDMLTFLNKYRQVGGGFEVKSDGIEFWRAQEQLQPLAMQTDVHPGFMTDWQQPFVITLTQAHGVSVVHETVYEERFGYTTALNQMGAQIQLYKECLGGADCRFGSRNYKHSAVIVGPTPLKGAEIDIPDLRAGFSYVIAALMAEGQSTLHNAGLIARGYDNFIDKLHAIGADIIE